MSVMVEHHVNWTWYLANLYLTAWATIPNETVQNEAGTWLSVLKPHPFQWPSFVGSGQSLEAWSPCSSWTIVKKSVWNNGFHTQSHTHTSCYACGCSLALAHARHATLLDALLHLHTHVSGWGGVGWGGLITFCCTCTRTSCTCTCTLPVN